jgi:hypothetical protein
VRANPGPTGVCLVRIQSQCRGLLITLRTNPDIEQVSTERVVVVTDIPTAMQVVWDFLTAFTQAAQDREPG